MQPQHATAMPPRLQQRHHRINRTPPLAVQLNGCACEGLCSLKSPPLLDFYLSNHLEDEIYFNIDHFKSGCYYNDSIAGGSDFSNDNFEDCYFIDGHEEYGYLNDRLGLYETPGAYREAPTTSLVIKDQLLPR